MATRKVAKSKPKSAQRAAPHPHEPRQQPTWFSLGVGSVALCAIGACLVGSLATRPATADSDADGATHARRATADASQPQRPYVSTFAIKAQYPHSPSAFTQVCSDKKKLCSQTASAPRAFAAQLL